MRPLAGGGAFAYGVGDRCRVVTPLRGKEGPMRRGAKPAKSKVEAKPPIARKSRKSEGSRVHDLEKRLAEALDQQTAETFYDPASADDSSAECLFDVRWAKTLTSSALNALRQELEAEGKTQLFEQLKTFLIGGSDLPSYDEASARTGLPRATVKTHVHRLRQRYREIVRREIARTVSAPHEIDEELRYLCNVLAEAA